MQYVIPILHIQNTLANLDSDPRYRELRQFCRLNIEEGLKFEISEDLENRWFPVVITNSVWLATKIMRKYFSS